MSSISNIYQRIFSPLQGANVITQGSPKSYFDLFLESTPPNANILEKDNVKLFLEDLFEKNPGLTKNTEFKKLLDSSNPQKIKGISEVKIDSTKKVVIITTDSPSDNVELKPGCFVNSSG